MNALDKCVDILIIMEGGARSWGKHIEDFIEQFSTLDINEINMLIDLVDAEVRFNFMDQVFWHIESESNNFNDTEKRKALNQLNLLVILEN